ncbi:hypothetical protein ACSBOB_33605 [Mesorhizobium sp. ASY16-5R]|uniref:hypothetical protein n=1 Tax=Mesorhizobium sp. ASY16-5R TaxID=3445772 RepID=UPI003FA00E8C
MEISCAAGSVLKGNQHPAIAAVSTILMCITLGMVLVINRLVGMRMFVDSRA